MDTKEKIIETRKKFLSYAKADKIQKRLISIYKKEYKPKHTKEQYYKLIIDNGVSEIERIHPQDNNYTDTVFKCFSVASQHVSGYTKEHCLDQIFDAVKLKKKRIKAYKLLPTLEELVNSNIKIIPDKGYKWKEKGSYEDSCNNYSSDIIIRMKKTGINKTLIELAEQFHKSIITYKN